MIQHITKPFKEFFKLEASSGIVLLIAAILALTISNGSYSEDYFSILKKYITLGTESFGLKFPIKFSYSFLRGTDELKIKDE